MRPLQVLALIIFTASSAIGQMQIRPGGKPIILGKDTLCYRYHFAPSDTLLYRIESRDSIVVPGYDAIEKERTEGLRIVCDSVTGGIYHLSLRLEAYKERQRSGSDTSSRNRHPWMQKTVYLAIDSLGRRRNASISDASRALACPGGMYQHLRLPIIDSSCRRQNQSWLSIDTISVPENGVPAPEIRQRVLWRVGDHLDTLGRPAAWIQYTLTGFGGMEVPDSSLNVATVGSIAEYGRLVMDRGLQLPLSSQIWQEVRFKMQSGASRNTSGRHLVVSTMSLMEIRSLDPSRRWKNSDRSAATPLITTPTTKPRRRR
ncbi:MAG: hypothetical protein FGM32_07345 [Candidatus Kapabacteria bacterium]|nr:hypothetical protein [Candidatus Kapabacteria bacterium]